MKEKSNDNFTFNLFIWVFFIINALKYVDTCIKIALPSPEH